VNGPVVPVIVNSFITTELVEALNEIVYKEPDVLNPTTYVEIKLFKITK